MVGAGVGMHDSLHALLSRIRPPDPIQRARRDRALRHPAAVDPSVAATLAGLGLPPPPARPADPLLLAANDTGGSTWVLAPEGDAEAARLHEDSARAWELAGRLAAHALPLAPVPDALLVRDVPKLAPQSPPPPVATVLKGESFGLSFFLAHVSRGLGVPIPADLVASAALNRQGALVPVDRLDAKLAAVRAWAPGVRRVLVAAEQVAEAERAAGPGLVVIGCHDVDEAWASVFAETQLEGAVRAAWSDAAVAARAARTFFRLAIEHPAHNLNWAAVGRTADVLAELTTDAERWRADVAAAIAWRHAGRPRDLPGAPPTGIPHPDRVALHAHRVQAANDGVAENWREVADNAERELPAAGHEHEGDLKLLGALGRLYASWGQLERARAHLARTSEAWIALDKPDDASYPLTERVRVLGLLGDAAALAKVEVPPTLWEGRGGAYLRLARGRAWVLCGDRARAAADLADGAADWDDAPVHVRASRLRWLHRLDPGRGHLAALAVLAARDRGGAHFAWCLARIDGGDGAAAAKLDGDDARQFTRCEAIVRERGGVATAADWFPY